MCMYVCMYICVCVYHYQYGIYMCVCIYIGATYGGEFPPANFGGGGTCLFPPPLIWTSLLFFSLCK